MNKRPDRDVALDCLSKLAPWRSEDRVCWYKCAAALKSVDPNLYAAFEQWSSGAPNFNARACQTTWKAAKPGKVGLGTLIIWAKQDGHEVETGESDARLDRLRKARAQTPADAVHVARDWTGIAAEGVAGYVTGPKLGVSLGLSEEALARLGVGWLSREQLAAHDTKCQGDGCWTFPMRGVSRVVGCRLRSRDGFKYAINSSDGLGLFVPEGVVGGTEPLFVIEGPTDCAAILDLGEACIGRPNNTAGNQLIRGWVALNRPQTRNIVIVVDRDQPDSDTGWKVLRRIVVDGLGDEQADELIDNAALTEAETGTVKKAVELARMLAPAGRTVNIVAPPVGVKDARQWLQAGATSDELWSAVEEGVWVSGQRYGWLRRGRVA